jgi:CRISPR-associated protein Cas2
MRHTFIVTYDISDPRRLRAVFKTMRGWGDHLQLSVFQCDLNPTERVQLEAALSEIINHNQDQVLFADIGLAHGRSRRAIHSLGRTYFLPEDLAIVV